MNKNIIYVSLIKSISDPRATKILSSLKKQYPTHQYHLVASEDTQNTPQEKSYHLHPLNKTLNRRRKRKEATTQTQNHHLRPHESSVASKIRRTDQDFCRFDFRIL